MTARGTRQRRVAGLAALVWALCALARPAGLHAGLPPSLPSSYWGAVIVDGLPASDGTLVAALIGGDRVAEQPIVRSTSAALYTLNVPADDPSTATVEGGTAGASVTFALNGALTPQSASWMTGTNTRLDLAAVTARFEAPAWTVDERAREVRATVRLGATQAQEARVSFRTLPGTAGLGDYAPTSGEAIVPAGQLTATISLAIQDDLLDEPDESFTLQLTAARGALLATPREAHVTIRDDDPPPVVRFERARVTTAERSRTAEARLVLSPPSGKMVQVAWATANGSALAGADYVPASGTLTFPAGATAELLQIALIADGVAEPPEEFTLILSSPSNAGLAAPSVATVTILEIAPLYLPLASMH